MQGTKVPCIFATYQYLFTFSSKRKLETPEMILKAILEKI